MSDRVYIAAARDRVYIAAASKELDRYLAAVALAESLGLEVVGKWGEAIAQHGSQGLDLEANDRMMRSRSIREAIQRAQGFVFLQPPQDVATRGGFWECGYAEGLGMGRRLDGTPWPLWSFHVGLTRDTPVNPPMWARSRARRTEAATPQPLRDFILVGEDAWAFHANDHEAIVGCARELKTGTLSGWDAWPSSGEGPPMVEYLLGRTFEDAWLSAYRTIRHGGFVLRRRDTL